jgi:hypothetical protein
MKILEAVEKCKRRNGVPLDICMKNQNSSYRYEEKIGFHPMDVCQDLSVLLGAKRIRKQNKDQVHQLFFLSSSNSNIGRGKKDKKGGH